jgi:hypothetical protein
VLLGELHALSELPPGDALAALLTEGAALQVEGRLRLLELAEQDAEALVASGQVSQLVGVDDAADRVDRAV